MEKIDYTRLKRCMQRARNGEELTIGFFGGSITQGCLASVHEKAYSYRVFEWWKRTFPQAKFHYVNGGIGGTSSHFGVSRIVPDLLMYQPDIVIIDFSVNDGAEEIFQETFEGVIRKSLTWNSRPAVLILNNVYYTTGTNVQDYHNEVGKWYHVPCISMKDTLYQRIREGLYQEKELTQDGLHPNDKGHALVADEIIVFLEKVKGEMDVEEEEYFLPKAMTLNAYENARRLTICEVSPELLGFQADTEEKKGHLDTFKNGWIGKNPGDKIIFDVTAACIAVQYRKTVKKPALRARLTLDKDTKNSWILDGNFEEDWGDCLYLESILHHGDKREHQVEIEILNDTVEPAAEFYLLSLIIA